MTSARMQKRSLLRPAMILIWISGIRHPRSSVNMERASVCHGMRQMPGWTSSRMHRVHPAAVCLPAEWMRIKEKADQQNAKVKASPHLPVCLIVDGYNMIFSWKELKEAASQDISLARDMLVDRLCAYQAFAGDEMIIVFDGYKRKDNNGTVEKRGKVSIVYTRTDQTADACIEKASYDMNGKYALSVASSDALIQNTVFSQGALRISARELEDRVVFSENLFKEKGGGR